MEEENSIQRYHAFQNASYVPVVETNSSSIRLISLILITQSDIVGGVGDFSVGSNAKFG